MSPARNLPEEAPDFPEHPAPAIQCPVFYKLNLRKSSDNNGQSERGHRPSVQENNVQEPPRIPLQRAQKQEPVPTFESESMLAQAYALE